VVSPNKPTSGQTTVRLSEPVLLLGPGSPVGWGLQLAGRSKPVLL
jgi:hypothetical protein